DLSRLPHPAGDAVAYPQPNLPDLAALRDLRPQLLAVVGEQVQRRAVGAEQLGDLFHDQREQPVEVQRGPQRRADLLDYRNLALFLAQARLERSQLAGRFGPDWFDRIRGHPDLLLNHSRPRERKAWSSSPCRCPSSWRSVLRISSSSSSTDATA